MRAIHIHDGHRGPVYALATGAEAATFLSGSGDGLVVRWRVGEPDAGEVLANVTHAVFSLLLLQHEGLLLIGTEGGALHVTDLSQVREIRLFEAHRRGIFRMLRLPGDRLACAGGDGNLSVWTLGGPGRLEHLRTIPVVEQKLRDLALSPDGASLAVACGDGSVRLFDTTLFNEVHTIVAHPAPVGSDLQAGATSLCFHPAKPVLLSGGKDGHLRLWRSDAGFTALHAFPAHQGGIYRIAFAPAGERIATASRDKTAKVWDARTLDPIARLDRQAGGHTHSVNDVRWADGLLLTASDDRRIIAWA
ncbi:MAG: hypothetical protein KIT10_04025 [Flavobacteriales bacterium]|nr:hypothetical protein [Flavobacteriales bacterium]